MKGERWKKRYKDTIVTCACSTDIVTEASSAGLLVQFLRVLDHLQGPPHNMAKPIHTRTTQSGAELFTDHYNNSHRVVVQRKK